MSLKFVDLDVAAEMMGRDWTVENVITKIQEGALTAYARIHCCPKDDRIINDLDELDDKGEQYEIVCITNIKEKLTSCPSDFTKWYCIDYEPIDTFTTKKHTEAYSASDNYCDQRVFGYLKTQMRHKDLIATEQICLLNTDIAQVVSTGKSSEKEPAQKLAEIRHDTEWRDVFVDKIIKVINEKLKVADRSCTFINHHRFVREANVPVHLVKSVKDKVRLRIKSDFNGCCKPLSRAPKKKEEDYFLLK